MGGIVAALSTWALNGLNNTTKFSSAREMDYAATSATNLAINSIRTSPISWSVGVTVPTNCWGSQGSTSSLTSDGISMSVYCATVQNLASPATRVVTFSTCRSSNAANAAQQCGADPLLQAVVTFDDYPLDGGPLLTQQCTSTCGDGAILDQWNWAPGAGINTISFDSTPPGVATVGGATYTPVASATSNLPVTISLDPASAGCSLSGSGVVSFTGVGTCIIDANQPGNTYYYTAATQVQQSITVVSLSLTSLATGTETSGATSVSTSTNVTAPVGPTDLIVAAYEDNTSQTCSSASGSGLASYSLVASTVWYSSGSNYYGMCVFSATGTATAGPVTVSFGTSMNYAWIQVVEVSGYNNTSIGTSGTNKSSGAGTSPATDLSAAPNPNGESDEVIFGDLTTGSSSPPTWSSSAPAGFTLSYTNLMTVGTGGSNSYRTAAYFGPAASVLTGALSGSANWGTIGVEIEP